MTPTENTKSEWGFLEKMIVSMMNSADKSSFSAKDKILFYKESWHRGDLEEFCGL